MWLRVTCAIAICLLNSMRGMARDSGEYFSFVQLVFSHINFSVAECFPH